MNVCSEELGFQPRWREQQEGCTSDRNEEHCTRIGAREISACLMDCRRRGCEPGLRVLLLSSYEIRLFRSPPLAPTVGHCAASANVGISEIVDFEGLCGKGLKSPWRVSSGCSKSLP